MSFRTY